MASKLVQPPIQTSHVALQIPRITKKKMMITTQRAFTTTNPWIKFTRFGDCPSGSKAKPISTIKVAEQSSGVIGNLEEEDKKTLAQIKTELYNATEGINRGIFGVPSAKKTEIEGLVKLLESQNPTPDPTTNLDELGGSWKLVYSTVTILGSKRTKLGLRDFINLGDFLQIIDVVEGKAVNVIKFNARGLNLLSGQLTIEASFKIASKSRVDIKYENSTITPDQGCDIYELLNLKPRDYSLMNVFRKNYDTLLGIFNPEGWLEITYVDDTTRIGRDNKGNFFILERSQ